MAKRFYRLSLLGLCLTGSTVIKAGDLDDYKKPAETDVTSPSNPTTSPTTTPTSTPPSSTQNKPSEGVLSFQAQLVSNMENGFHILGHGYKAVCVDSQGVVAQARMDMYAAVNGEVMGENAEPLVKLRPELEYLRPGATSGTCEFKACLPKKSVAPGQDFSCHESVKQAALSSTVSRPAEYIESNVTYAVSGKDIALNTKGATVSAYHPVFGFAAPAKAFKDYQSPLVLDLLGKGSFDLVDVWSSKQEIRFDLVADGAAVRTGWVGKNSAFLALDRNGNNRIDNGLELFGEYTDGAKIQSDGRRWENGFLALAQYDSNKDGSIDAKDEIYPKIIVWQDRNQDGKSQKLEMKSLKETGVVSISLAYSSQGIDGSYPKVAGNEIRLMSSALMKDGSKRKIADIWFRQRRFADRPVASIDFQN